MVGTDGKPEIIVSGADNFQNIMEEYGDEMIFMFVIGLIIGILLTCFVYEIIKFVKFLKENKNNQSEDKEGDTE